MTRKPKDADPLSWIHESLRALVEPMEVLALDPNNARAHDEKNLKAIAASLKRFGQLRPIVANRDNRQIEAGNATYMAAKRLGWTHIAVLWVVHDAGQQRGFALADNRTAEMADWDDEVLADLLRDVAREDAELYAELLLAELEATDPAPVNPIDLSPVPKTAWVLVKIPAEAFSEASVRLKTLGDIEGILLETTWNDGSRPAFKMCKRGKK